MVTSSSSGVVKVVSVVGKNKWGDCCEEKNQDLGGSVIIKWHPPLWQNFSLALHPLRPPDFKLLLWLLVGLTNGFILV